MTPVDSPKRRILAIVNPVAGQNDDRDLAVEIRRAIESAGFECDLQVTRAGGDALRWAAGATGVDRIIVAGGDGTVMEAISGLVKNQSEIPLAQIPTGTANLLARALAVPIDVDDALELALHHGMMARMDVGYLPGHDRYFALIAGAGWDAQLIKDASREMKDRLGFLAYVVTGIKNLFKLKNSRVTMTLDGETRHFRAHTVMVVNAGEISGTGIAIGPGMSPHDGTLDVAILSPRTFAGILRLVFRVLSKRFGSDGELRYFSASKITIDAKPPLKLEIDGEYIGSTPFEVEAVPDGVRLLVPASYAKEKGIRAESPTEQCGTK